jgi:hypothetical protein
LNFSKDDKDKEADAWNNGTANQLFRVNSTAGQMPMWVTTWGKNLIPKLTAPRVIIAPADFRSWPKLCEIENCPKTPKCLADEKEGDLLTFIDVSSWTKNACGFSMIWKRFFDKSRQSYYTCPDDDWPICDPDEESVQSLVLTDLSWPTFRIREIGNKRFKNCPTVW